MNILYIIIPAIIAFLLIVWSKKHTAKRKKTFTLTFKEKYHQPDLILYDTVRVISTGKYYLVVSVYSYPESFLLTDGKVHKREDLILVNRFKA